MNWNSLPESIRVRRARKEDQRLILKLQSLTNRPRRQDNSFSDYFIAEINGRAVGTAALRCRRNSAYLYGLTVLPQWRRRGIGHLLTAKRLDSAEARCMNCAYVMAMFWNIRFFKRHKFKVINKTLACELEWLHKDFEESWCSRSAVLSLALKSKGTRHGLR
jgi:N-acetylglutamate synthase-like GNAT family acetyltransferase